MLGTLVMFSAIFLANVPPVMLSDTINVSPSISGTGLGENPTVTPIDID